MLETIIGIIGAGLLAVVGWAVTLNSRVAVLEADRLSLVELMDRRFDDVTRRLSRIEDKLDKEN